MSIKEIQELVKLINRYNLVEFNMKDGDFEIAIRSDRETKDATAPQVMQMPQATFLPPQPTMPTQAPPAAPASPATGANSSDNKPAESKNNYKEVRSPMVGTFYRSGGPEKPPFIKVGDTVTAGDVVCIIEAMKLFNEIESELSGTVVKVLVEDAQPVEYDQVLFLVDPA